MNTVTNDKNTRELTLDEMEQVDGGSFWEWLMEKIIKPVKWIA